MSFRRLNVKCVCPILRTNRNLKQELSFVAKIRMAIVDLPFYHLVGILPTSNENAGQGLTKETDGEV